MFATISVVEWEVTCAVMQGVAGSSLALVALFFFVAHKTTFTFIHKIVCWKSNPLLLIIVKNFRKADMH